MSDAIVKHLPYSVYMDEAIKKTYIETILVREDNLAHCFDISILNGSEAVTLPDGAAVTAYFVRYSDNATITLEGTASGNVISVTLNKSCYNKTGQYAIIIKMAADEVIQTFFYGEGTVYHSSTDTIVDEENIIPSLSDLLAQIAVMEAATAASKTATTNANTATTNANTATDNANNAADAANAWANATATAESVEPDEDATVDVTTDEDGTKHMGFKIPRGQPGVMVSETEPTDPNVNVWIKPDGGIDENGTVVDFGPINTQISQLKETKANAIIDTSARASSHTLHAQDDSPIGVTLYGATTETGSGDKSPDNPYTISGLESAWIHAGSPNLIEYPYITESGTINGVTFTVNDDGSVTVSGTATATTYFNLCTRDFGDRVFTATWQNDAAYTLSGTVSGLQLKYDPTNNKVYFQINSGVTVSGTAYPMLNAGDTALPYEPYNANTYTLPLLPAGEPLMGNGTVDDTVENDVLVDGERKCRVVRRWKTVTLDGSEDETYTAGATVVDGVKRFLVGAIADCTAANSNYYVGNIACNLLPTESVQYGSYAGVQSIGVDVSKRVYICIDGITDVVGLRALLVENPLEVTYELATPETYVTDPVHAYKPDTLDSDTVTVAGSGETAVEYAHETKHYIDSQIAAAVALALNR